LNKRTKELWAQQPGIARKEIAKIAGTEWRQFTDIQKAKYGCNKPGQYVVVEEQAYNQAIMIAETDKKETNKAVEMTEPEEKKAVT